jgi:adenosylcobinamide kinase/adenosylcobinamide-phosphate guanylyltransferase
MRPPISRRQRSRGRSYISRLTFIIGGARSGKSAYAERLAGQKSQDVLYIATGQGLDEEMRARIAAHRAKRPAQWETLELPTGIGAYLLARPPHADLIIVDCLTLLVSNLALRAAPDPDHPDEPAATANVHAGVTELLQTIDAIPAEWLVVSNEVGQGLVPPYPIGRIFRDLLGWANQRVAEKADQVYWMVAGIPVPVGAYRT